MNKLWLIGLVILCVGIVSANELQVDVNQPLIIKTSCSGVDATADIMIYSGTTQEPENMYLSRVPMTQVSPTDFIDTETFTETGTYTAYMECTYDGGFLSQATTTITVTEYTNLITPTTYRQYDYYADLYYDVYFKADPTKAKTIRFNLDTESITFQPKKLNIVSGDKIQLVGNPLEGIIGTEANNVFSYTNIYGEGLTLQYNINTRYVKEDLLITDITNLPKLRKGLTKEPAYLELNSIMTTTTNKILVDGNLWDGQTAITTSNRILIQDIEGNNIYILQVPVAFDADSAQVSGTYTLTPKQEKDENGATKIEVSVQMPYDWFMEETRVYPVKVDPTIDTPDGTETFDSSTPRIIIEDPITIPSGEEYTIIEQIVKDNTTIYDTECETDIIDDSTGIKVVDFRSFYNDGWGNMKFTWGPSNNLDLPVPGTYTIAQYCWKGITLDQNKIYSNTSLIVI